MSNSLQPLDYIAHQSPLSREFFRQEYWSGLPFPPPRDLPDLGIQPASPTAPALQVHSWPLSHQGSPQPSIAAAAAAKSLKSCPTLCDPRDGSLPGSPVPGILQALHDLKYPSCLSGSDNPEEMGKAITGKLRTELSPWWLRTLSLQRCPGLSGGRLQNRLQCALAKEKTFNSLALGPWTSHFAPSFRNEFPQ